MWRVTCEYVEIVHIRKINLLYWKLYSKCKHCFIHHVLDYFRNASRFQVTTETAEKAFSAKSSDMHVNISLISSFQVLLNWQVDYRKHIHSEAVVNPDFFIKYMLSKLSRHLAASKTGKGNERTQGWSTFVEKQKHTKNVSHYVNIK